LNTSDQTLKRLHQQAQPTIRVDKHNDPHVSNRSNLNEIAAEAAAALAGGEGGGGHPLAITRKDRRERWSCAKEEGPQITAVLDTFVGWQQVCV